jgi:hypothetical protein
MFPSNGKGHGETPVQVAYYTSLTSFTVAFVSAPKTGVYAVDLMFGRVRVLVTVSAAFPISPNDGEVVYNFRGTLDTANFLGQLFRTFSDVLNLGNRQEEQIAASTSRRSGKPYFELKDLFGTQSTYGRFSANSQQNSVLFLVDSQQNFSSFPSENIQPCNCILNTNYKVASFE